jgi:hypothetical protein
MPNTISSTRLATDLIVEVKEYAELYLHSISPDGVVLNYTLAQP